MSGNTPIRSVLLTLLATFFFLAFLAYPSAGSVDSRVFLFLAVLVQTALLCAPLLLLMSLYVNRLRKQKESLALACAIHLLSLFTVLFLLANYKLQQMFGFYFNYFVLNLLMTPGGVEAMGVSTSTNVALAMAVLAIAVIMGVLVRFIPLERGVPQRLRALSLVPVFFVLLLVQSGWYAWSEYRFDRDILATADRIIWYVPVTARTLLEDAGFTAQRPQQDSDYLAGVSGKIDYPATPAQSFKTPYNIVWLVAESWRADMLTPEIMPNTAKFAEQSQRFLEHYSGGNGTRMGMFSQFYGLYGSYWFDFLSAARPPLMMEMVRDNDYAMQAYTSSRFSYPEFDKTIFSSFSQAQLQSYTEGAGWERDRKNVGDMLQFIESTTQPFFSFMFFESAHANYYFPAESVIEPDYIDDFNYLTVDIEKEIGRIKARYINATHHLDSQLGRVFDALEARGLLDNTIVIVTGDHGEEFLENGRWGHNSTFSQEQIRVPLVVHIPGLPATQVNHMTSHLDLPATVLAALGVNIDPATYSYGSDLLAANYAREYSVASDWHGNTLITPDVKMVFSKKGAAYGDGTTTLEDEPLDIATIGTGYRKSLNRFASELVRFYQ